MKLPLLITLGDPNGLGPEVAVRLLARWSADPKVVLDRPIVLLGPEQAMDIHCRRLRMNRFWQSLPSQLCLERLLPGLYAYTPSELIEFRPAIGEPQSVGGRAAIVALELASQLLMTNKAKGLVTLPLSKALLKSAGYNFLDHTEFLAVTAGLDPDTVCMHLYGPKLRISLVTRHVPLARVSELVTFERILRCLELTSHFIAWLGIKPRTIAVCSLNPHAGENGIIGQEEIKVIIPAITAARIRGVDASGPFPADSLFYRAVQGEFAAVVAMYHDQGLGPLKLLHFAQSVNITLGLPFVRTSVDHGTAFHLVGRDLADTGSFAAALVLACKLCDV